MMAKKEVEEVKVEVQEEVVIKKTAPVGTTKMTHPDGRVAFAHDSMIDSYKSGGFKEEE